jgi:diguanylate cyclase (GGDEF)-like protein
MMMDLQGFKGINDRLGHPVGDTMLVKTARVIRNSLRAVDAGCRYGGDEFVAVLPNTSLVGSLAVAERIRQRVAKIQLPRRVGLQMGLHYGVATFPLDGKTLDFLVRTCDQRLYDCRRYNSDPRTRRHPRFAVQGLGLRLANGGAARQREFEVKDIGYGGLAFIYSGARTPRHLEGELIQEFASDTFHVSMRPVSVRPLSDGRSRVGCAYVH